MSMAACVLVLVQLQGTAARCLWQLALWSLVLVPLQRAAARCLSAVLELACWSGCCCRCRKQRGLWSLGAGAAAGWAAARCQRPRVLSSLHACAAAGCGAWCWCRCRYPGVSRRDNTGFFRRDKMIWTHIKMSSKSNTSFLVVSHKAVAEVSKIGNHRQGELLRRLAGRANPLTERQTGV